MGSGVTVIGAEAPSNYHVAPRNENPSQVAGSLSVAATPSSAGLTENLGKKKRGRPRKYGSEGIASMTLSPLPVSSSAPQAGDFLSGKRGRGRPVGLESKQEETLEMVNLGEQVACTVGANFTPHIITVNVGEDVSMKIISFSQQGPRAICILSANGAISNVTLRQTDSSGGTLTYEGHFEILSLAGSFIPIEIGGTRSRAGGMSVSLAGSDGHVVGGSVDGLLVAASPVQVVVGSFLPGDQQEQKPRKQKTESIPATTIAAVVPSSNADKEDAISGHGQHNLNAHKPNNASSSMFQRDNWATMHSMQRSKEDLNRL